MKLFSPLAGNGTRGLPRLFVTIVFQHVIVVGSVAGWNVTRMAGAI